MQSPRAPIRLNQRQRGAALLERRHATMGKKGEALPRWPAQTHASGSPHHKNRLSATHLRRRRDQDGKDQITFTYAYKFAS